MTTFGTSAAYIGACMKAGVEPARRPRPQRAARGRLDRLAAVARGLRLGLRARRLGHLAVLDQRRHRPVHGVRRRRADAAGLRGRAAGARAGRRGRVLGRGRQRARRRGRRARPDRADAVDADLLLGRRRTARALRESYFSMYPGIWRHGDWIEITDRGTAIIYGRSDSTINRGGDPHGHERDLPRGAGRRRRRRRAGGRRAGRGRPTAGCRCSWCCARARRSTTSSSRAIKQRIREDCSPRHVPNEIHAIAEVPRTLSGKVLEVPVKRILMGQPAERPPAATRWPTPPRWTTSWSSPNGRERPLRARSRAAGMPLCAGESRLRAAFGEP